MIPIQEMASTCSSDPNNNHDHNDVRTSSNTSTSCSYAYTCPYTYTYRSSSSPSSSRFKKCNRRYNYNSHTSKSHTKSSSLLFLSTTLLFLLSLLSTQPHSTTVHAIKTRSNTTFQQHHNRILKEDKENNKNNNDKNNDKNNKTDIPSVRPSLRPSTSHKPTNYPSYTPSVIPTSNPSTSPSKSPSDVPSFHPTFKPTTPFPTVTPGSPTAMPTTWESNFEGLTSIRLSTLTHVQNLNEETELETEVANVEGYTRSLDNTTPSTTASSSSSSIPENRIVLERVTSDDVLNGYGDNILLDVLSSLLTILCETTVGLTILIPETIVIQEDDGVDDGVDNIFTSDRYYRNYCRMNLDADVPMAFYNRYSTVLLADFSPSSKYLKLEDRRQFTEVHGEFQAIEWIEWTVSYVMVQIGETLLNELGNTTSIVDAVNEVDKRVNLGYFDASDSGRLEELLMESNGHILGTSMVGNELGHFKEIIESFGVAPSSTPSMVPSIVPSNTPSTQPSTTSEGKDDDRNGDGNGDGFGSGQHHHGYVKKDHGILTPTRIIGFSLFVSLALFLICITKAAQNRDEHENWEKSAIFGKMYTEEGLDNLLGQSNTFSVGKSTEEQTTTLMLNEDEEDGGGFVGSSSSGMGHSISGGVSSYHDAAQSSLSSSMHATDFISPSMVQNNHTYRKHGI